MWICYSHLIAHVSDLAGKSHALVENFHLRQVKLGSPGSLPSSASFSDLS